MPTFVQTNLTLGVCGRKCCALYVGGGKHASTMSFISPTSSLVLKNMLYLNHAPQVQLPNKTQTQKSNPLKSEGMGHTFIKTCPLAFPLLLCLLLSCSDMFPIAIGIKELMTHKPLHLETSTHVFWKGLL